MAKNQNQKNSRVQIYMAEGGKIFFVKHKKSDDAALEEKQMLETFSEAAKLLNPRAIGKDLVMDFMVDYIDSGRLADVVKGVPFSKAQEEVDKIRTRYEDLGFMNLDRKPPANYLVKVTESETKVIPIDLENTSSPIALSRETLATPGVTAVVASPIRQAARPDFASSIRSSSRCLRELSA